MQVATVYKDYNICPIHQAHKLTSFWKFSIKHNSFKIHNMMKNESVSDFPLFYTSIE